MALNSNLAITDLPRTASKLSTTHMLHRKIYLWGILVTDAIMLSVAFVLAYWLRFDIGIAVSEFVSPVWEDYLRLFVIIIPCWLGLFALVRIYDFRYLLGGTSEYARAVNACTSGMMLVVVFSFFDESFIIARGWLVMAWLFSCLLVCFGRFIARRTAYMLRVKGYFVSRAIIVGLNEEAIALATQLQDGAASGLAVLGFVEGAHLNAIHDNEKRYVLGTLAELPELIRRQGISEVIVATTALTREQLLDVFQKLNGLPNVNMRLSSGLYEVLTTGMQVTMTGSVPLMNLARLRLDSIESALKRLLDLVLVLWASVFLLPIFGIISLLIKLDSPGPALYRRRVMGVGGQQFDAFKFRTMYVNGDEILAQQPALQAELEVNHKLKNDPRITMVGHWLRLFSLDELSQLINVFLGQMSLVGPRMISPEEMEKYGSQASNLLTVKPGITGLWQVSGRSDLSYDERVQLDMNYIRNYTIWLDLQILFIQTLPAVIMRRGAY